MNIEIIPETVTGTVNVPESKSELHRILVCAALADKPSSLNIGVVSEDIGHMLSCLRALGAEITMRNGYATVLPIKEKTTEPFLDCGECGTALRFLLPVAAALGGAEFACGERLAKRPAGELLCALASGGAVINGELPSFTVSGGLKYGEYRVPGNVSSQYISGLLLALPLLGGDSEIVIEYELESVPYVDMTVQTQALFGVTVTRTSHGYSVKGNQRYVSPGRITVGGDWSNAAYFLAMGALGANITVSGLDEKSAQGDRQILKLIENYGATVNKTNGICVKRSFLRAINTDIRNIPDLLPVLTVLSAFSHGESVFTGGSRLHFKESDRLRSCAVLINSLGGCARELEDGLAVTGTGLHGGTIASFGDHRIVMAAAAAACACGEKVILHGAEAVNKSYPAFFGELEKLGVKCNVV